MPIEFLEPDAKWSAKEWHSLCAFCQRSIPDGQPVYAMSASLGSQRGLIQDAWQGSFRPLRLGTQQKVIPVIVVGEHSAAKRAGADLMFMVCSERCAAGLEQCLSAEPDSPLEFIE